MPPPPLNSSNHFDICQNYEIEADQRDGCEPITGNGAGTILQWGGYAVHQFDNLNLNIDFDI